MGEPNAFDEKGSRARVPIQRLTAASCCCRRASEELLEDLTAGYNPSCAKDAIGVNALVAKAMDLQAADFQRGDQAATGSSPFQAAVLETMRVRARARHEAGDVIAQGRRGGGRAETGLLRGSRRTRICAAKARRDARSDAADGARIRYFMTRSRRLRSAPAAEAATALGSVESLVIPGSHVVISSEDREMQAIVLMWRRPGSRASDRRSVWSVTLALPDSARTLLLPFAQVLMRRRRVRGRPHQGAGWADASKTREDVEQAAGRLEEG